jgi:hypothetical protein
MDGAPGDLEYLIPVDESQSVIGFHHDSVEEIFFGDLQHVLDRADRLTGRGLNSSADLES